MDKPFAETKQKNGTPMTMTPEQQDIVGEAMNLLIQDGSSGMADSFVGFMRLQCSLSGNSL